MSGTLKVRNGTVVPVDLAIGRNRVQLQPDATYTFTVENGKQTLNANAPGMKGSTESIMVNVDTSGIAFTTFKCNIVRNGNALLIKNMIKEA